MKLASRPSGQDEEQGDTDVHPESKEAATQIILPAGQWKESSCDLAPYTCPVNKQIMQNGLLKLSQAAISLVIKYGQCSFPTRELFL